MNILQNSFLKSFRKYKKANSTIHQMSSSSMILFLWFEKTVSNKRQFLWFDKPVGFFFFLNANTELSELNLLKTLKTLGLSNILQENYIERSSWQKPCHHNSRRILLLFVSYFLMNERKRPQSNTPSSVAFCLSLQVLMLLCGPGDQIQDPSVGNILSVCLNTSLKSSVFIFVFAGTFITVRYLGFFKLFRISRTQHFFFSFLAH